ncbi:MAG: hypothetical protein IPI38_11605 [Gemmatimonadetes bacterium]|jgi:hypothetical protein|nr:hypothetical protein [Gemmatimonadota bacterium]MBP9198640.1 hypothetical protein [Gemmatimonadales bacterium]MBK6781024.1 hypothetical protein [Gemmatimonadota bacterium]MBK7716050.1 hypothetical protein [Gemmatimonadota bacterium]MBK7922957.1 hypothetical protein [Gemmatimonadota bacterium]
MLKPFVTLAAAAAVGVVLWKLLGLLLLPLVGIALGLFITVLKFAFVGAALFFALWLFRRITRDSTSTA